MASDGFNPHVMTVSPVSHRSGLINKKPSTLKRLGLGLAKAASGLRGGTSGLSRKDKSKESKKVSPLLVAASKRVKVGGGGGGYKKRGGKTARKAWSGTWAPKHEQGAFGE